VSENAPDENQKSEQIPEQASELLSVPQSHPILEFTDEDLAALLRRVVQATATLGAVIALFLGIALGWQTGVLFAIGAAISIGSIYEWGRLFRHIAARMDAQKSGGTSGFGTATVVGLFLLRLVIFAVVIYGSLKCFHGSPIALLCGLGLALAGLIWEALKVLRG
jgi:hypothetical protein